MTQLVLLVGATGMLGGRIAFHLLEQPGTRVRLLVRNRSDERLRGLLDRGVEVLEGDLADNGSLDRATAGVDTIVSAVQGGPKVIVDGQVALAEAGKRNGVRRILPSDFGLDLFKASPGEHAAFNMRAEADAKIAAVSLDQVNILQGGFMDLFLSGTGAIDLDAGTVSFFGDGHLPIEVTSVDDTARMTARVAVDHTVQSGKFAFAGDRVSFRQAAETVSRCTGREIRPVSLGSEADLRAAMAAADPQKRVMLGYLLYMTNGQTRLTDLQNSRYSDVQLETFADFASRKLS